MPKDREIIEFGKTGYSALNTYVNEQVHVKDNEQFEDLENRMDNVAIGRREDTVDFAMTREERQLGKKALTQAREGFSDMQDRGQENNIFGDVGQQKRQVESGLRDLTSSGIEDNRSWQERASDRGKDAPLTTDADKWKNNKDDFDFPGVDTGPAFREDPPDYF